MLLSAPRSQLPLKRDCTKGDVLRVCFWGAQEDGSSEAAEDHAVFLLSGGCQTRNCSRCYRTVVLRHRCGATWRSVISVGSAPERVSGGVKFLRWGKEPAEPQRGCWFTVSLLFCTLFCVVVPL